MLRTIIKFLKLYRIDIFNRPVVQLTAKTPKSISHRES